MSVRPSRIPSSEPPEAPLPAPPTAFVPVGETRRAFLDVNSATVGTGWSVALRTSLKQQGRAAAGGFPGTMSEARAHVNRALPTALSTAKMPVLSSEEREWSARVVYANARKDWLAHGDRDEDE